MSDYYDLGDYSLPVTTASAEAQTWFDRGLAWCYGFNHDEAIACFEKALASDPGLAMAHWGVAYAAGPNYNKPWEAFDAEDLAKCHAITRAAIEKALAAAPRASAVGAGADTCARGTLPVHTAGRSCDSQRRLCDRHA